MHKPTMSNLVLVVEDEPVIRLCTVTLLEQEGFTVFEAANADDAVLVLERQGDISLIITDVDMPGSMDGLKLARDVRRRWPWIKLIVTSGKRRLTLADIPLGSEILSKPYSEDDLSQLVSRSFSDPQPSA